MKKKCKLIFALDTARKKDFVRWIDTTKDLVEFYKVGLVPFTALGDEAITILKKRKKKIFLDLKFFDIPNTIIKASLNVIRGGIDILDFHLWPPRTSLKFTIDEIKKKVKKDRLKMPIFLGVTVLTSVDGRSTIQKSVLELSKKAKDTGFNGAVLSGREVEFVRRRLGKNFKLACPGVRLKSLRDDQKRIVTPRQIRDFADFIIVGRPIYEAKKPRDVIENILKEL